VKWDSRRPAGQRILSIHLDTELSDSSSLGGSGPAITRDGLDEEVKREKGGRKYKVVTREYMAQGHDGYSALKGGKYLVDDESGQMMSTIVRKYLLGEFSHISLITPDRAPGSRFVNRMSHFVDTNKGAAFIQPDTEAIVQREQTRQHKLASRAKMEWKQAASLAIRHIRSKRHYQDNISVANSEHMSNVDVFDGSKMRCGKTEGGEGEVDEDLLQIHPVVDGRFKDIGRDS
jgi:5'-nucleotidase